LYSICGKSVFIGGYLAHDPKLATIPQGKIDSLNPVRHSLGTAILYAALGRIRNFRRSRDYENHKILSENLQADGFIPSRKIPKTKPDFSARKNDEMGNPGLHFGNCLIECWTAFQHEVV
jgi:hypothetical protein